MMMRSDRVYRIVLILTPAIITIIVVVLSTGDDVDSDFPTVATSSPTLFSGLTGTIPPWVMMSWFPCVSSAFDGYAVVFTVQSQGNSPEGFFVDDVPMGDGEMPDSDGF